MGYLYSGVDAKGAAEGVSHPDLRYSSLGDVLVIHESRKNPGEKGVMTVVQNRALTEGESISGGGEGSTNTNKLDSPADTRQRKSSG